MSQRIAIATIAALVAAGCYGKKSVATSPVQHVGNYLVEPVVTGSFVVDARSYKPFRVVVAADASNPQLEGTFSAKGANNDIEVLLLEETQYLNWQNRHKFRAVYESGRVTADRVRMALPPDAATYFVVFSNRFSLLSQKDVSADLSLKCDRKKKKAE